MSKHTAEEYRVAGLHEELHLIRARLSDVLAPAEIKVLTEAASMLAGMLASYADLLAGQVLEGAAHTDHPMRHWDRTCPACNPDQEKDTFHCWNVRCQLGKVCVYPETSCRQPGPAAPTLAELSAKAGESLMANARFMDELLNAYRAGRLHEVGDGEVVVPDGVIDCRNTGHHSAQLIFDSCDKRDAYLEFIWDALAAKDAK